MRNAQVKCLWASLFYMVAAITSVSATAQPVQSDQGNSSTMAKTADTLAVEPIPGQLSNSRVLTEVLQKLPLRAGESFNILQLGDSHTAGRMFTGAWRSLWQAKFGAAGRGLMAAGKPYDGYLTHGVTTGQSKGWRTSGIFGRHYQKDNPRVGLSGFTITANRAGETASLVAEQPDFFFDRFVLCGLTGPDMGSVEVTLGAQTQKFSFLAPTSAAACFAMDASAPVASALVKTLSDRQVSLTSWTSQRRAGGVMLSNLGVVGASFSHLTRADDSVVSSELQQLRPDLLVVAFGTNEGFARQANLGEIERGLIAGVERLRHLLGYDVPVLLLGPPDVLQRQQVASTAEDIGAQPSVCAPGWVVPENVTRVRDMQRAVAQRAGFAFWDWQAAMGGACASALWTEQSLQMQDHIHLTARGAVLLGEALARDLDQARITMLQRGEAGTAQPQSKPR